MGFSIMSRERLPTRRRSWTQEVRIAGQKIFMTVGEYPDGRPGEIFVDMSKEGTFVRGVMDALARMVSISLQCGSGVDAVVHALKGMHYPPSGVVEGSKVATECFSVTDWIARELDAEYGTKEISKTIYDEEEIPPIPDITNPSTPDKPAGYISEDWRTGA